MKLYKTRQQGNFEFLIVLNKDDILMNNEFLQLPQEDVVEAEENTDPNIKGQKGLLYYMIKIEKNIYKS